jgi:hypothetical protein
MQSYDRGTNETIPSDTLSGEEVPFAFAGMRDYWAHFGARDRGHDQIWTERVSGERVPRDRGFPLRRGIEAPENMDPMQKLREFPWLPEDQRTHAKWRRGVFILYGCIALVATAVLFVVQFAAIGVQFAGK